jgi:hypothetical protein
MYMLAKRIFDKMQSIVRTLKTTYRSLRRRQNGRKTDEKGPKTASSKGLRPHCYIMATMGLKVSVYVKINAAECLFSRQLTSWI